MDFLSQTYVALRGPTGAPQTAVDTIGRLADRLSPTTLLQDRRASVLALKGLTRDHRQDVGDVALNGLLEVLYNDAEVDADIGKAVLETLNLLCDAEESRELGLKYTDAILKTDKPVHTLFALLADTGFYTRLASLQLLITLLQNRRPQVQSYFLTASVGTTSVLAVIEEKREIVRNEAITMLQLLLSQNPDIQKILAFQGAFEKCFSIISQEGGVEGGVASQEALICVDTLLRYNSSNQSYFRETGLPPTLCQLILFPPNTPFDAPAPQEFALQFWDAQKLANASYVVGVIGLLVNSKGGSVVETGVFIRCLLEIALASNAPPALKTKALKLLPHSFSFPLGNLQVTPYVPVPETNGEEWDKLEPMGALDALVELALHGEYHGQDLSKRTKEGLELRTAAIGVFENFVGKEEIKSAIVQAMSSNPDPTPLLEALCVPPSTNVPLDPSSTSTTHFACLLFAHLLRSSLQSKATARMITPPKSSSTNSAGEGSFFVPADGPPPPPSAASKPRDDEDDEDDDGPQTILQILNENLTLAFLTRSRAANENGDRECDRLIVGYLALLSQWLWEDPAAVREFLNAGGLGALVEAINSTSASGAVADGEDFLVPGLCAFLLGVVYEFNREPGEVTRHTIYPLLSRLSVDVLVSRLGRVREDERFKSTGPESAVLPYAGSGSGGEVWFDWSFVDFFKSNYFTIQRGFSTEPDQMSPGAGETAMLVASLREVIGRQSEEINLLRSQLQQAESTATAAAAPPTAAPSVDNAALEKATSEAVASVRKEVEGERADAQAQIAQLKSDLDKLSSQLQSSEEKRKDMDKEQEDLLVLLDELSSKRKKDKEAMKGAGLEVSEDEDEDEDEDDDEEEE